MLRNLQNYQPNMLPLMVGKNIRTDGNSFTDLNIVLTGTLTIVECPTVQVYPR